MCPICASHDIATPGARNGYPIGRCKRCYHLYCMRMPTNEVLHELYERYSYETNHLGNIPEFVLRSLATLLQSLAPYRRLNRLLDVGFGAGAILLAAQRAGWEVHGLEWSVVSPPEHLHLFSKTSVTLALRSAGFEDPRIRTEGFNPYEVVSRWRRRKLPSPGKVQGSLAANGPPRPLSRVESAYALNALLMRNSVGRGVKELANLALTLVRLGDELKVWARAD